jgi:phosphate transport system substrate-binding protein
LSYALQQNLAYAYVKNKQGQTVEPCVATVAAATVGFSYPSDLRFDLVDSAAKNAYPITDATWALIYQNQTDPAKAAALINYFSWVLTTGQNMTLQINYTPLGPALQALCIAQLKKMTVNGSPVVH